MTVKKYNVKIHFLDDCKLSEIRKVLDMLPNCMQDVNRHAILWGVRDKPHLAFYMLTASKFNQLTKSLAKVDKLNLHVEITEHDKV